ncbi:MAG: type II secretion system protein [Candidatus Vogelbacteria bacterium]|nr:type II secretion system protein [Candidatus Vogelbacteria bacterium]
MSALQAKNRKLKAAFTLIELLVVIAIISLLSSIVLASLSQARGKARVVRTAAELRQMVTAIVSYYNDTDTPPPFAADINSCGCYTADIEAIFVTGNYRLCYSPFTAGTSVDRPSGWSGPYMSRWPETLWGDSIYGWTFYGCNDLGPPYGGGSGICATTGGSDRYILSFGLVTVTAQNVIDLAMLEAMLDPDTDPGGGTYSIAGIAVDNASFSDSSIAWITEGFIEELGETRLGFRYAPFRGLLSKQDSTLTESTYPRAVINCS